MAVRKVSRPNACGIMARMLPRTLSTSVRRAVAATSLVALLASLAACGGDKASEDEGGNEANVVGGAATTAATETGSGESGAPSNDTVEAFIDALASRDPDELADAMDLVVPGSYAEAMVTYYIAITDAVIGAGYDIEDLAGETEEIDGGYRICNDSSDKDTCAEITDIVGRDELVSGFKIDGEDRTDKLVVGSGESIPAEALADVTLRAAGEQTTPDRLNVVIDVTSGAQPISISAYSATYRTPEGRQVQVSSDASFVGSTELQADSTTTVLLVFQNAAIGGDVTLELVSEDYETLKVQIPTS